MDILNMCKDWVLARWSERTSWDGAVIVAVSLSMIVLGDGIWWAAWLALAYGIYALVKGEG